MKKIYILTLLAVSFLLAACEMSVNDSTLDMTVLRVRSEQAGIEIFPQSNDFYYIYGVVTVEKYNSFRNDRRFIEADFDEQEEICETLNELFAEYGYPQQPIEELLFYQGAVDEMITNLQPNTDYYAYAYCLNSRHRPIHKLIKTPFTTPAKPHSNIDFDVRMANNRTVVITPTNGDTYFYETATKTAVFDYYQVDIRDTTYDASLMIPTWFAHILYNRYRQDFNLTVTGQQRVDLAQETDNLRDGDIFYLGCVGYTTEETTKEKLYQIIYHSAQPSEIEQIDSWLDDDSAGDDDETIAPALNRLRRNPKMVSALQRGR